MRCQICNKETNNWSNNKHTGEYESICGSCRRAVADMTSYYTDMDDVVVDADMTEEELLVILEVS